METIIEELTARINVLETKLARQEKAIRKIKKDMIPESERKPRKPSGFAKPTYLSPDLCRFLNVDAGTELPRTEVTKRILEYVKENNLQNPEARRIILVDDKLKTLLNPTENEDVTYFSIQKLIKPHYVKPEEAAPAPVTPVAAVESAPKSARGRRTKK